MTDIDNIHLSAGQNPLPCRDLQELLQMQQEVVTKLETLLSHVEQHRCSNTEYHALRKNFALLESVEKEIRLRVHRTA